MSNEIFPSTLNGYLWDSKKKPLFNNIIHSPATGRDIRIALYSQPMYEFTLNNGWLTKVDKDTLMGFFLARQGAFDNFLYTDEDSTVTAHAFAVGDGVATTFQLGKTTNGFFEICHNPVGIPVIYLDSVLLTYSTDYTVSSTGLVTFVTAPANGAVLSWTGSAYYRCVFVDDSLECSQFAHLLYECNEIRFKGSFANKV